MRGTYSGIKKMKIENKQVGLELCFCFHEESQEISCLSVIQGNDRLKE